MRNALDYFTAGIHTTERQSESEDGATFTWAMVTEQK